MLKSREAGRIVNVACLLAVGVNSDGRRQVLGLEVVTAEDGAGWRAFLRSLRARELKGRRVGNLGRASRAARCDRLGAARSYAVRARAFASCPARRLRPIFGSSARALS